MTHFDTKTPEIVNNNAYTLSNQSVQSGNPVYRLLDFLQTTTSPDNQSGNKKSHQCFSDQKSENLQSVNAPNQSISPEPVRKAHKCKQHTSDHSERSQTSPEVRNQSGTSPETGSCRAQSAWKKRHLKTNQKSISCGVFAHHWRHTSDTPSVHGTFMEYSFTILTHFKPETIGGQPICSVSLRFSAQADLPWLRW